MGQHPAGGEAGGDDGGAGGAAGGARLRLGTIPENDDACVNLRKSKRKLERGEDGALPSLAWPYGGAAGDPGLCSACATILQLVAVF